jgi:hypothetical protein
MLVTRSSPAAAEAQSGTQRCFNDPGLGAPRPSWRESATDDRRAAVGPKNRQGRRDNRSRPLDIVAGLAYHGGTRRAVSNSSATLDVASADAPALLRLPATARSRYSTSTPTERVGSGHRLGWGEPDGVGQVVFGRVVDEVAGVAVCVGVDEGFASGRGRAGGLANACDG